MLVGDVGGSIWKQGAAASTTSPSSMWASMDKKGTQWMKHGERVGNDPLFPTKKQ